MYNAKAKDNNADNVAVGYRDYNNPRVLGPHRSRSAQEYLYIEFYLFGVVVGARKRMR